MCNNKKETLPEGSKRNGVVLLIGNAICVVRQPFIVNPLILVDFCRSSIVACFLKKVCIYDLHSYIINNESKRKKYRSKYDVFSVSILFDLRFL
jgi:hypothetical protein